MTRPILALAFLLAAQVGAPEPRRNVPTYEPPPRIMAVFHALTTAARRYGLDQQFVFAVAWQESRFDPLEISPANARGLMQISKRYQDEHVHKYLPGMHPSNFDWRNPMHSALLGCAMLAAFVKKYGRWGALVCYNAGENRFKQLRYGVKLPAETVEYCRRIL